MSAQSEKVRRELEQRFADLRTKTADRILEKMRERTPVRTGYTRSRWITTENGSTTNVSNDQGEAVMRLNDGSSTKVAAGFIEQAIDETIVEMKREVGNP